MNWMNLNGKGFLLITILVLFFGLDTAIPQDTPFKQLIGNFREGKIFHSDFTHQYIDSYTEDTVVSAGKIWVGDNSYKVKNRDQTVLVDSMISRVYDERRNRVIISKYEPEEDDFAPSRFLNGTDTTYAVSEQKKTGSTILIVLNSKDPFAIFKKVEITLSPELIPKRIFALDQADNLITTSFSSGKFIPFRKKIFTLEYPDSAEIIDMRN